MSIASLPSIAPSSLLRAVAILSLLAIVPTVVRAQQPESEADIATEEPDPTRLDVERLPPEAIHVTRDLYAHGLFVEAQLGGIGFVNGVGELINGGPWASLGLGVELADFLHVVLSAEGSMHRTNAPEPPAPTAFEIVGGTAALRFQINFTEAFAIWLAGQFSVLIATTDVLELYGFQDSANVGFAYGGQLGIDWHLRARHYSLGLLGGVRHYPSLESETTPGPTLGIHGSAYLRYVF